VASLDEITDGASGVTATDGLAGVGVGVGNDERKNNFQRKFLIFLPNPSNVLNIVLFVLLLFGNVI
jgi:hypothetical protein